MKITGKVNDEYKHTKREFVRGFYTIIESKAFLCILLFKGFPEMLKNLCIYNTVICPIEEVT